VVGLVALVGYALNIKKNIKLLVGVRIFHLSQHGQHASNELGGREPGRGLLYEHHFS
jgi:hypothetical protein